MTDEIVLTAPDTQSGLTVNEALALRQSCRDYLSEELSLEEVSEVLWAASGINRADGKQTAPSALALYPIQVYAFFAEGAYRCRWIDFTIFYLYSKGFKKRNCSQ